MTKPKCYIFLILFLISAITCLAQKPFTEGTVIYNVTLASPSKQTFSGTYTFFIKGNQIRKEIKLNNGYQDVVLLNCGTNKVYSLQNKNGKKYAIELSMQELQQRQAKFDGFKMANETNDTKKIAGYSVYKANVNYTDGSTPVVYYTKDWQPTQPITFERFPNAKFLPVRFSYTDEHGMAMTFEAQVIDLEPIENSRFRIPADYKMISYKEYKELSE